MKKLYFIFSAIILFFVVYISFQIPVIKEKSNLDLFVVGVFFIDYYNNYSRPALIHINPNNNFSINTIDLNKFILNSYGLHEVRPLIANNEFKIALGAYSNDDPTKKSILIILNKSKDWDNLQFEFEEEIDDERIRAVFTGDIDNDGEQEVIIGTKPEGILKYYKLINNKWKGFQLDSQNLTIHDIIIEDTNGNGIKEIIATTTRRKIVGQNSNISGEIIGYEFDQQKNIWKKDIIWQYSRFINFTPVHVEEYEHARYMFTSDIDNDGIKEIIVNVIGTGNIELFEYNGVDYTRKIIEDKLNIHNSAIAVGDIDRDGNNEIIALTLPENTLLMYDYNDDIWQREVIVDNLISDEFGKIGYLFIINSNDNSYAKIVYTESINYQSMDLYYLEHDNNVWNKNYISTINKSIYVWGIFQA